MPLERASGWAQKGKEFRCQNSNDSSQPFLDFHGKLRYTPTSNALTRAQALPSLSSPPGALVLPAGRPLSPPLQPRTPSPIPSQAHPLGVSCQLKLVSLSQSLLAPPPPTPELGGEMDGRRNEGGDKYV